MKGHPPKRTNYNALKPKKPIPRPKESQYAIPRADSTDNNDSNEQYSHEYHRQQSALRTNNGEIDDEYAETEHIDYSNDYNFTTKEELSPNNSLLEVATPNPISELKIVNVTSLPAEKHNEIMNNDDNAMNAMDSVYNHQMKINKIISSTSNSNVFGIAKKVHDPNDLLTVSTSKPYRQMPGKSVKKQHSRIQKLKQQMQSNYRSSQVVNVDEGSSMSGGVPKENTDSDEYSNSKFNSKQQSRRKDTLTPLDCEMEFLEVNMPVMKKQAHMTDEQRLLSSQLETVKSIKNPNSDLLRKVAFLRVCVNYMMTELEGETFNFGKNITYDNLKTKYNSKRMP